MNENQIADREWLESLEQDMNDDWKSWQDAEKEIISAKEWRDKRALNYANSATKYFTFKNKVFPELPPEVINELTETI